MALARPLQLHDKPVTHVENFCATGSEAMRNAAYAVASGAYDVAMAIGVEKVKDSGYQGLVGAAKTPTDGTGRTLTAAAMFAMCAPGYGKKYGVDDEQMREVLARIALEEPLQRRPQPPRAVQEGSLDGDDLRRAADGGRARRLRLLRCRRRLGGGDHRAGRGRAPSTPTSRSTSRRSPSSPATAPATPTPRTTTRRSPRSRATGRDAYAQAGVTNPREQIAMAEVHDCFTPAELLIYEDLQFAERGSAWKEVLDGTFDLKGDMPVNPDGGLKSFGHPVGASGSAHDVRGVAPAARRSARGAQIGN